MISADQLAEQWHYLRHQVMEQIQKVHRQETRAGLTNAMIAERIELGESTVNDMVRGQYDMSFRDFHKLARGMGYRLRVTLEKLP